MASISCNCGKTRILFSSTAPRTQSVCCCNDCWDRFNVMHTLKGGPAPQERNLPAIWLFFENQVVVESGNVYFFKLHSADNPGPINAASSCCNTCMMGYCDLYHHQCLVVPSQETGNGKFHNLDSSGIKNSFLSFRNGKERFDDLFQRQPNLVGIPEFWFKGSSIEDGGFEGSGEWENALGSATAKMQEDIVGQKNGKSFDELIGERGGKEAIVVIEV